MTRKLLSLLLVISLGSCGINPGGAQWVVRNVESRDPHIAEYYVVSVRGFENAFFRDSVGKFTAGDTLTFVKTPHP